MNVDFRTQEKRWNILSACALALMVLIAGFDLLVPKPKVPLSDAEHQQKVTTKRAEIVADRKRADEVTADNAKFIWTMPIDKIGPTALSAINELARLHQVTITAFRPQKQNEQNGLILLPYLIVMQGAYPGVTAFLHDLQQSSNKLAVNLVQVAAADQSTDQVNASIGVIAYTGKAAPVTKPAPAKPVKPAPLPPVGRTIVKTNGRTKKS